MKPDDKIENPAGGDSLSGLDAYRRLREATDRIKEEGLLSEADLVKKFTIVADDGSKIILMPMIQGKKPQILLDALEQNL
jgi:hypothetical protein